MAIPGIELLAEARHHILLQEQEAESARHVSRAHVSVPGLYDRVLANLGDRLISWGLGLKGRRVGKSAVPVFRIG